MDTAQRRTRLLLTFIALGLLARAPYALERTEMPTLVSRCAAQAASAVAERSVSRLVETLSTRKTDGVFIQQEQEGMIFNPDPRDSRGNFFRYYRPKGSIQADLLNTVIGHMNTLERIVYRAKTKLSGDSWESLPAKYKLDYLQELEQKVIREQGEAAAWTGPTKKTFLLMERKPGAPSYVSEHPSFERRIYSLDPRRQARGGAFSVPEIVTRREEPSATIDEAIGRTQTITQETGHAGTHYHVFVEMPLDRAREAIPAIQGVLSSLNEQLLLDAVVGNAKNLTLDMISPWDLTRGKRVDEMVRSAGAQNSTKSEALQDLYTTKLVPLAFRYWGTEDGKIVFSFELRAVENPFASSPTKRAGGEMGYITPVRDYTKTRRMLAIVKTYAELIGRGIDDSNLYPQTSAKALDSEQARAALGEYARAHGLDPKNDLSLDSLTRKLEAAGGRKVAYHNASGNLYPALLMPFSESAASTPETREFYETYVQLSEQIMNAPPQNLPHLRYLFEKAYHDWAAARLKRVKAENEAHFLRAANFLLQNPRN